MKVSMRTLSAVMATLVSLPALVSAGDLKIHTYRNAGCSDQNGDLTFSWSGSPCKGTTYVGTAPSGITFKSARIVSSGAAATWLCQYGHSCYNDDILVINNDGNCYTAPSGWNFDKVLIQPAWLQCKAEANSTEEAVEYLEATVSPLTASPLEG